ncbi:hypothetical protein JOF35_005147 [Streptomyces demainii]|uniref:Uncharacterized protein n=1 Tax=Streptomyces demainii TaxID=588122 RepID=A0ABT9KWR8_9ACTN|nr:hypothetical protein [Streptomyces demainii]
MCRGRGRLAGPSQVRAAPRRHCWLWYQVTCARGEETQASSSPSGTGWSCSSPVSSYAVGVRRPDQRAEELVGCARGGPPGAFLAVLLTVAGGRDRKEGGEARVRRLTCGRHGVSALGRGAGGLVKPPDSTKNEVHGLGGPFGHLIFRADSRGWQPCTQVVAGRRVWVRSFRTLTGVAWLRLSPGRSGRRAWDGFQAQPSCGRPFVLGPLAAGAQVGKTRMLAGQPLGVTNQRCHSGARDGSPAAIVSGLCSQLPQSAQVLRIRAVAETAILQSCGLITLGKGFDEGSAALEVDVCLQGW